MFGVAVIIETFAFVFRLLLVCGEYLLANLFFVTF